MKHVFQPRRDFQLDQSIAPMFSIGQIAYPAGSDKGLDQRGRGARPRHKSPWAAQFIPSFPQSKTRSDSFCSMRHSPLVSLCDQLSNHARYSQTHITLFPSCCVHSQRHQRRLLERVSAKREAAVRAIPSQPAYDPNRSAAARQRRIDYHPARSTQSHHCAWPAAAFDLPKPPGSHCYRRL